MRRTIREADLNDYLYFAVAVEHGAFTAASRALNIPKSKLSRRIAGLEDRLGVRLIERSTRKFRVTELGRTLYERCRSIRDEAEEAEAAIAEPRTDVRMSCPTGMMDIVAPTLPQFLRHFPKVRLHVVATDRPVNLIEDRVDVAIRVRTKLDDSTALTMRTRGVSRKLLVASPECASSLGESIDDVAVAATLDTSENTGEIEWTLIGKDERVLTAFFATELRSRGTSGST
jgi:DNA-binding transcriptional LysR family regulator